MQILPVVLSPVPHAEPHNGGSLSHQWRLRLQREKPVRGCQGLNEEGEHNRLGSYLPAPCRASLGYHAASTCPAPDLSFPLLGRHCRGWPSPPTQPAAVSWERGFLEPLPGPLVRQLVTGKMPENLSLPPNVLTHAPRRNLWPWEVTNTSPWLPETPEQGPFWASAGAKRDGWSRMAGSPSSQGHTLTTTRL